MPLLAQEHPGERDAAHRSDRQDEQNDEVPEELGPPVVAVGEHHLDDDGEGRDAREHEHLGVLRKVGVAELDRHQQGDGSGETGNDLHGSHRLCVSHGLGLLDGHLVHS